MRSGFAQPRHGDRLDSPPLLLGFSQGGLLAQLVAARTRHSGVVAACPSPSPGVFALTPKTLRSCGSIFGRHYLPPRPWAKPLYPPTWQRFRRRIANAQTEETAVWPSVTVPVGIHPLVE